MKVVSLRAENIKRLSVVEIAPGGGVVEITGQNGNGKTSLLDSIYYALAGAKALPTTPIRRGEEHASVHLDLGDLQVRRRFTAQEDGAYTTSVVVENKDGARFQKPQEILNALVGEYTFDPLAFTQEKPAQQVELLKNFVRGFDFAADKAAYDADYGRRTEANRKAKDLRAEAGLIVLPVDVPGEPADVEAILVEMSKAGETNAGLERVRLEREREAAQVAQLLESAHARITEAEELRRRARALEEQAVGLGEDAERRGEDLRLLNPLPPPVDTADLTIRLQAAQAANNLVERAGRRRDLEAQAEALESQSSALTAALEARLAARAKAVADADMPVPGLGFREGEVTLNGLPFDQASGAEQLRASVAIAAALNPKLRIAFIRDASRLDSRSWAALATFASEHDLQVWAESVESSRPGAVVIEDGRALEPMLQAAE